MTTADSGPPAGGGHAWERLREQRAKDLGEEPEETPDDSDEPEPGQQRDVLENENENENEDEDQQGK